MMGVIDKWGAKPAWQIYEEQEAIPVYRGRWVTSLDPEKRCEQMQIFLHHKPVSKSL